MSLVVARQIDHEVRIISDTKMSRFHALHQTPVDGGLKCIVISPTCCISFAGNVPVAERALTAVMRWTSWTRNEVTSYLLKYHRENGCVTDFIVAVMNRAASIDRISGGCLEAGLLSAWIGDYDAFVAYQATYHTAPARIPHSQLLDERFLIAGRMSEAFNAVVADPGVASVDDFTISVTSRPVQEDGFRYLSHAFGSGFKAVANTTEETSITETLGVEGGSYHYSVLVPTSSGVGAVAVHIREARLGVLFSPAHSWTASVVRHVDIKTFIDTVRTQYGIAVDGIRT